MHIYFVRHGETMLNRKKAYYGALDTPLTELGKRQAETVGRQLEGIAWNEVYISNKIRTLETARAIVREQPAIKLTEVKALAELDFGQWEGLDNESVRREFPEDYAKWCDDWLNVAPSGGERFMDFFDRVKAAFEAIVSPGEAAHPEPGGAEHPESEEGEHLKPSDAAQPKQWEAENPDKNILICAHNGTLRVIFAVMCGLGPEGTWHFNFEQDAWSQADFEYGNFTIRKINTTEETH